MTKKIALIHTSFVFFERERLLFELFDQLLPLVERINIVEEKMLAEVMKHGVITSDVNKRMAHYVMAAEAMHVDLIFNTCSSLGPAFDLAKQLVSVPCLRIDDAMAEKAANMGKKIAVLATVPTTLPPTIDLVVEKANAQQKKIEVQRGLAEGAFNILMDGDIEKHDNMVSAKAKEVSGWADTIVLAQCSMARLAERLSKETNLPVLASPHFAVEQVKEMLL